MTRPDARESGIQTHWTMSMTRTDLLKRIADEATRPLDDFMHQPVEAPPPAAEPTAEAAAPRITDLFIWFEDTSARKPRDGLRGGIAGLPESLLPWPHDDAGSMRVIDRRYAEGHLHLLSAVRLRCQDKFGERVAAIYTAALSVGTVAWIGTGAQYERAWQEMYRAED